jgi:hypothetical protein
MSDKFANQIRNMAHEIVMEETKSMRNQLTAITAERDKLQAQCDTYKGALEEIRDNKPLVDNEIQCNLIRPFGWMGEYKNLIAIASQSLKEADNG